MGRPSWDAVWMEVARTVGARSMCVRRQVGAVVVGPDNRDVWVGYNGPPAGLKLNVYGLVASDVGDKPCDTYCAQGRDGVGLCPSIHAEVNALMQSTRSGRFGGTVYSTTFPCLKCALAVANSGVTRLVAPRWDDQHNLTEANLATGYLGGAGVNWEEW